MIYRLTLRIWSPSSKPSLAAGLSSSTPATNIPTSFPPASLKPTLSPFLNFTSFMLGLGMNTQNCFIKRPKRGSPYMGSLQNWRKLGYRKMLSSGVTLGTGASAGLTGRSTSGWPGWAYTGLGSGEIKAIYKLSTNAELWPFCLVVKFAS